MIRGLQAESVLPGQLRYQMLVMQSGKDLPEFNGRYEVVAVGLLAGRPWTQAMSGGAREMKVRQYARVEGMIDHPAEAVVKTVQVRLTDKKGAVRATQSVRL